MGTSTAAGSEPIAAPESEKRGLERLSELLKDRRSSRARVLLPGGEEMELPDSVLRILRVAADALASGAAMELVRFDQELTSQQAADMLNVSRQYVTRLADGGDLPAATTKGGHRRFRLADVLDYKRRRDAQRRRALDELGDLTEEYGGYDETRSK